MQKVIDWEKEWEEKTKGAGKASGPDYWNKRAEDYADYIRMSDYEHGKKIREIFEREGILKAEFEVLDIGAGPGSLTIPFAEPVKKVTAVEPAEEMIKHLLRSSLEKGLNNIEIIHKTWQEVDSAGLERKFDLAICSNAVWQFPRIGDAIMKMNNVSRGYCCIAHGVISDEAYAETWNKLGVAEERFDRFIYLFNILYQRGVLANVKVIDTVMRRSVKSAISMWEYHLAKQREPTEKDREIIRRHVSENSWNGIYKTEGKMAVVWWNVQGAEA